MFQETSSGHFVAVIKAIDDIIQVLKDEQAEKLAKRDDGVATFRSIAVATVKVNHTCIKVRRRESASKVTLVRPRSMPRNWQCISAPPRPRRDHHECGQKRLTHFMKAQSDVNAAIALLQQAIDALNYRHVHQVLCDYSLSRPPTHPARRCALVVPRFGTLRRYHAVVHTGCARSAKLGRFNDTTQGGTWWYKA